MHCGYDLRGTPAGLCPECGCEITVLSDSPIPWAHRKAIGRWTAFWRTVRLAIRRPRALIEAATLPIDYRDAQHFRRLVITWLWLWGSAAMISIYICAKLPSISLSMIEPTQAGQRGFAVAIFFASGILLPPVPIIGLLITLVLGSTSAGFFARPQNVPVWLRNRAVALTRYTLAPLMLMAIAIAAAAVVIDLSIDGPTSFFPWNLMYLSVIGGAIALMISVVLYAVNTVRVSVAVLQAGVGRVVATLLGMAAIWIGSLVIGLGLFPLLVGYGCVVIGSLR